jgi:hypothetical protein
MKQQHLIGLGVAVAVLAGYLFTRSNREIVVNRLDETVVVIAEVDSDKVASIEVGKAGKTLIAASKSDAVWRLASGHKVAQKTIDDLLADLKNLRAERRNVNLKDLKPYGLASDDITTDLIAKDASGAVLATVKLGKKGPDWGSAWTQREGQEEVLLIAEGAVGKLADKAPEAKSWIERQPAKVETAKVTGLRLSGELTVTLAKSTPAGVDAGPAGWNSADGKPVETDKAEAILSALNNLYADDVAAQPTGEPTMGIDIALGDAKRTAVLFAAGEKKWTLVVDGQAYAISDYSAKSLRNKGRELLGRPKLD